MQKPSQRDPRHRDAVPLGDRMNCIDDIVGVFALNRRKIEARAPRVVWPGKVAAKLAAQQAARKRAPDHQPEPFLRHQRNDLALDISAGNRIIGLDRFKARPSLACGETERLHDLPGHQVRAADVADLTGAHEIVERPQCFVERRREVGAVDLVEVDIVRTEPNETVLDRVQDVPAGETDGVGTRPRSAPRLGRDDHVLACNSEILDCAAQNSLRLAFGIDIGGTEEVDAGVDRKAQKIRCRSLIELSDDRPEFSPSAEGHGAEANLRDKKACAA